MLRGLVGKLVGDSHEREMRKLQPLVDAINGLEPEMERRRDPELRAFTDRFKGRLKAGETLDDLLVEAYAVVRETAKRQVDMRPFDVQLIGGIVLHQGKVAEMKTGEGKTLVATMPLYLNALRGRGAHLVTVNDYLARRDALWMGAVYHTLGQSVGLLQSGSDQPAYMYDPAYQRDPYPGLRPVPRRQAYAADITYGTNNEFGFDYLRDNLALQLGRRVQRPLYYAIVDEVDNIFIDEARTPLIISGPSDEPVDEYRQFAAIAPKLEEGIHYELADKERSVYLTDEGLALIEQETDIENIYDEANYRYVHYMQQALKAQVLFLEGRDYIRQRNQVILVDQHTGRLMPSRRLSEGLHQAIEAKEGVSIQPRDVTSATITIQNYFRMYDKLAGMSGTAVTEEEEFFKIYGIDVVAIPTNKPVAREDHADVVYRSEEAKLRAVAREILACHSAGQPVLVGTTSVEMSERLSKRLSGDRLQMAALAPRIAYALQDTDLDREERNALRETMNDSLETMNSAAWRRLARALDVNPNAVAPENLTWLASYLELPDDPRARRTLEQALREGIDHEVLNAKEHTREAAIIARAGEPGAVTIATNMAGRGVDIKLGGELSDEVMHRAIQALEARGLDPYTATAAQMDSAIAEVAPQYAQRREQVLAAGGLHVLGTERHEARRIDNQLRGRSGRQGEPGSSRFYLSLEDDLMRRFGRKEMLSRLMEQIGDDFPIEHGMVSRTIERAQTSVEGYNFDLRKHLLEYDDVLNRQRETIYDERLRILQSDDMRAETWRMLEAQVDEYLARHGETPAQRHLLFVGMDDVMPLILPSPKAPFQGPVPFGGHFAAFPPFTIGFLADQWADRPVEEVRAQLDDLLHRAAAAYGEQIQDGMEETVRTTQESYEERLERYRALLDEKIGDYLQLVEERGQPVDPRRLVQYVERTYPLQLSTPGSSTRDAEIETLDDLQEYWLEDVEVEFHRQTAGDLVERVQGRLPLEAASALERVHATQIPPKKLVEEAERVRELASRQPRDEAGRERLARLELPEAPAPNEVLDYVAAIKEASGLDYRRLDRLVSHALGAHLEALVASYRQAAVEGDEGRLDRDLERLQAATVEGRKGRRARDLVSILKELIDLVHVDLDAVHEILSFAVGHEYDKWAQRQIAEVEADARRQPLEDTTWTAIAEHLMATHYMERQVYDRGHRRQATWTPRLTFGFLGQAAVEEMDAEALRPLILDALRKALRLREMVWGRQEFRRWHHLSLDALDAETEAGLLRYVGAQALGELGEQPVDELPREMYDRLRFVLALRSLEEQNPELGELAVPSAGDLHTLLEERLAQAFEEEVLSTPVGQLEPDLQEALVDQLGAMGYLDDEQARQGLVDQGIGQWDRAAREEAARFLGHQKIAPHQVEPIASLPADVRSATVDYLQRQRRFMDEDEVQHFLVHQRLTDLPAETQDRTLAQLAHMVLERSSRRKISNLEVDTRQVVTNSLQRMGLFTDKERQQALLRESVAALDDRVRAGFGTYLAREQLDGSSLGDLPRDMREDVIERLREQGLLANRERVAALSSLRLDDLAGNLATRIRQALIDQLRADLADNMMEALPADIRRQVRQALRARDYFVEPESVRRYERTTLAQLPVDRLLGLEAYLGHTLFDELVDTPWSDLPLERRESVLAFLTENNLLDGRAEELRLTQTGRLADLSEEVQDKVAGHLGRQWLVSIRDRRPPDLPERERALVWAYLRDEGYFSDEFKEELFAFQRLEEFGPELQAEIEQEVVDRLVEQLSQQTVGSLPGALQEAVRQELSQAGYFLDQARLQYVLETPTQQLSEEMTQPVEEALATHLLVQPAGPESGERALENTPLAELPEGTRNALWRYLDEIGYFVDEKRRAQTLDRRLEDLEVEIRAAIAADLVSHLQAEIADRPVAELDEEQRQGLREALERLGYFEHDEIREQVMSRSLGSLSRADLDALAQAIGQDQIRQWTAKRLAELPGDQGEAILAHLHAHDWFLDRGRLERLQAQPLGELQPEARQSVLDTLLRRHLDRLWRQPLARLDPDQQRIVRQCLQDLGLMADEAKLRPLRQQRVQDLDGAIYQELLHELGSQATQQWGAQPFRDLEEARQNLVIAYLGHRIMARIERQILLHTISRLWIDYLTDIEDLRRGIGLEAYGQRDPLVEYKRRAFELFEDLGKNVRRTTVRGLFRRAPEPLEVPAG